MAYYIWGDLSTLSSSHARMWELVHKESWALKNGCFWTVVLEKTLKSPLDCKEIQPGNPKGNQSWIFIGRTEAEVEAPILWPLMRRANSNELKRPWCLGRLKAGGEWDARRWNCVDGIPKLLMSLSKPWQMVKDREAWLSTVRGVAKSQTWLSDWTMMPLK